MSSHYTREPSPPSGGSPFASWCRALLNWVKGFELKSIKGGRKVPDPSGGYHLIIDSKPGGGRTGWFWSDTKAYDKDSTYAKGEVIILVESDDTVTDGWPSADVDNEGDTQKGIAGAWVAMRDVSRVNIGSEESPDYEYHVPRWPWPVPDSPDSEDNYWWPVPFYPKLLTDCLGDGTEVSRYFNAQDETPAP